MDIKKKLFLLVAIAVVLVIFGSMVREVYAFGVDDSFIFYRYAENIASGSGFVFNAGEPAGEGFTSWLWTLWLALFHWLGFTNMVVVSKIWGLVFHVLGAGLMFLVVQALLVKDEHADGVPGVGEYDYRTYARMIGGLVAGVFLLNYRLLCHSVSGMETSLYVFVVVLLAYVTVRGVQASSHTTKWWLWLALATLGAFWVRPEGILLGGLSLLTMAVAHWRDLLKLRVWAYLMGALLLPLTLFIGLKMLVFGYPMPHSYYHKLIVIRSEYNDSLRHLLQFVGSYFWLIGIALIGTGYALFRLKKYIYLYFTLLFGVMASVYLFFYPAMNYLHRFYMPYVPLLWLLVVPLCGLLVRLVDRPPYRRLLPVVLVAFMALLVIRGNNQMEQVQKVVKGWSSMVNPKISRAWLGHLMAKLPKEVVVANSEMGVIPYYSGLTCIDMAGLTDPHIAHSGLTMKYLTTRQVELILFPKDVKQISMAQWQAYTLNYRDVFFSDRFRESFICLGAYPAGEAGKPQYFFYADRTSPRFKQIQQWWHAYETSVYPTTTVKP